MPVKKRKEVLDSHRVKYVSIVHSRAYTAQEIALRPRSEQRAGEGRHFEHPMVKVDGRIAMAVLPVPYRIDFERLRVAMGAGTVARERDGVPGPVESARTQAQANSRARPGVRRFPPTAKLQPLKLVAKVVGLVEAPRLGLDLPLDVRGTAFQQRVWQTLREIPTGETASYADIANRIGAPKSVRAVAQACAANALAVAIPCHRVVRNDGGLSGYRLGVERKRALLEKEAHA